MIGFVWKSRNVKFKRALLNLLKVSFLGFFLCSGLTVVRFSHFDAFGHGLRYFILYFSARMASLVWKCFFLFRFLLLPKWITTPSRLLSTLEKKLLCHHDDKFMSTRAGN